MRIIYLTEFLNVGGLQHALLRLSRAVKQVGHSPEVWVYRKKGPLTDEFLRANIPIVDCSHWPWHQAGWLSKQASVRCAFKLLVASPTVFHSFSFFGNRSEPIAVSLSGTPGYVVRLASAEPAGFSGAWELKFDLADRIVVLTNYARTRLLRKYPHLERKICVIPNGVDTSLYIPPDNSQQILFRRQCGLPEQSFLMTCVARLEQEKNQIGLIRAFAKLASITEKDVHLCLIGSGSDLPKLESMVREFNLGPRVHFLGSQSNVYPFLAASDLFVLLSSPPEAGGVESLSNALLEAMSCGVPVIVSRNGSEEVVTDGVDGFIVNWDDTLAIVDRMYAMIHNDDARKAFGEKARQKITQQYTIDQTIKSNLALYEELPRRSNSIRRITSLNKLIVRKMISGRV